MSDLLGNLVTELQALLTGQSLVQLAGIPVAVPVSLSASRPTRATERAKAALADQGIGARLTEALLIASPHATATVLIAAFGGVLHALKTDSGIVDHAITLAGLLLLIRIGVYLVRLSLGDRTKGWGNA